MALILAAIVLMTASGCGRRENADKEDNNIIIYKSNENADGFDTETVSLDALTPENIMAALIDAGVVPSDVKVLDFKQEEDTITLDLSKTFEEYVNQMGTAGEYATVGSVVNTYLDAYDAKAVSLLVEGGTWSTGHAEYETLQGRYTYDAHKITGLLLIMGMFLAGCGANSGSAGIEEDAVMQELYDRSEIARGYTDPIFQEYLDQYDSDCEIKETSFGFEPAETPAQAQYFVEYQYSNGVSDDLKYFYQVQVDDNHNCIVLKEGEGQAEMETSTEDAEIEWLTQ